MPQPRVLILRAAGTNCDEETAFAFESVGAVAARRHVNRLIESPQAVLDFQIVVIPGGFSYGDDIASGKILANQLVHHLRATLDRFLERGGLLLGICNGFQVLVKAGLLPGPGLPRATLTHNDSGRFEARWVRLRAEPSACPLFEAGEIIEVPVAHGEGKIVLDTTTTAEPAPVGNAARAASKPTDNPPPESAFAALRRAGCVSLRYVGPDNAENASYPWNPNGSQFDIAGLTDPTGRIVGLMPHPERAIVPAQKPDWTRHDNAVADGRRFFQRAVALFV